jgi:hypothetical protein
MPDEPRFFDSSEFPEICEPEGWWWMRIFAPPPPTRKERRA